MALTASGAFDQAIGKTVQRVAASFTMDLPIPMFSDFTSYLVAANLDAQNQTGLPEGIRDQVGFSTIGGSITVGGRYTAALSIADLFNPDNQASPLWRVKVKGRAVTFGWGVRPAGQTPEIPRKLTGRVTGYTVNHDDGTVTFNVTDLTADWANAPETGGVITPAPYNVGLTSEFAMDSLIRSVNGGVSTWPKQRVKCVVAAGMRTTVWPEVGQLDIASLGSYVPAPPAFTPGAMGSALLGTPATGSLVTAVYRTDSPVGTSLFLEAWVGGTASGGRVRFDIGNASEQISFYVLNDGLYFVHLDGSTYKWSVPVQGAPHYVAIAINLPALNTTGTTTGTLYLDGQSSNITAKNYQRFDVFTSLRVTASSGGTVEGVQLTTEDSPSFLNNGFVPAAVLDPSLNPLTVVPPIPVGSSGQDILQQMAAAELGYARRDEYGVFRFSNRITLAQQTVSRTLSAATSLKSGFSTDVGGQTEYDHVQVPYTEWTFGAASAIYTQTGAKKIPKRQTTVWRQTLETVVAGLDTTVLNLPQGQSQTDGNSWYRASSDVNGKNEHPGLGPVTVRQVTSSVIEITVVNRSNVDAWLVAPANYSDINFATPSLWIGGTPAMANDEAIVDVTIGAGTSVFTVASNSYNQDADAARDLGYFILNQVMASVRDFTNVSTVPDSRIQIADKQFIDDAAGRSKIREYVTVWGWNFNATFPQPGETGGSWEQQLNLRAVGPPGAWIGGVAGRSEGDLTTYGY